MQISLGLVAGALALPGMASSARAQAPARIGGGTPVHCVVMVDGKKALDMKSPARRPYSLHVPGRKLEISFDNAGGAVTIQIMDAGRLVSHGSWSSAATLAKASSKTQGSGSLSLVVGDTGASPHIEASCSPLRAR